MTENSPLADLLGIETVEGSTERTVARLTIRNDHKTPTGVIHSGTILSLADNCATFMANRANNDGPNPGAFMVLVDLHSTMLGNQSDGVLTAESRVVRCGRRVTVIRTVVTGGNEKTLAEVTTTHIPA
jgi:1,4-dihydroxy-2-naphthoyl-CoA hydrolase